MSTIGNKAEPEMSPQVERALDDIVVAMHSASEHPLPRWVNIESPDRWRPATDPSGVSMARRNDNALRGENQ